MDEPTGSLDPQCKRVIWDAIKYVQHSIRKIHYNGFLTSSPKPAVLLTTHDLLEAEFLANNITIMDKGHVLAYGDVL